jgi:hypothetical protein
MRSGPLTLTRRYLGFSKPKRERRWFMERGWAVTVTPPSETDPRWLLVATKTIKHWKEPEAY